MNVQYLSLSNKLATCGVAPIDQPCVAAYAVAQAIAYFLPMPTSCVDDPTNYYRMNLALDAKAKVSCFNECVGLNAQECLDAVQKLWMLRYNTLYPFSFSQFMPAQYGYFDTIMGVGLVIDEETHSFVNKYKEQTLELFKMAYKLLEEECKAAAPVSEPTVDELSPAATAKAIATINTIGGVVMPVPPKAII